MFWRLIFLIELYSLTVHYGDSVDQTSKHNVTTITTAGENNRRLREDYVPLHSKHENSWLAGRRVRDTSTSRLGLAVRDMLQKASHASNMSISSFKSTAQAVNDLHNKLGAWDTTHGKFENDNLLVHHRDAMNIYDHRLRHSKGTHGSDEHHKSVNRLEENLQYESAEIEEAGINNMFDIIVLTGVLETNLNFLEQWRSAIEHIHLIIVQQGEGNRFVEVPEWADFELYTRKDIKNYMGPENFWIFDSMSDTLGALNFGFLISDREYIYVLDRDTVPVHNKGQALPHVPHEIFRSHALNLRKPSLPYYFASMDPFKNGGFDTGNADFTRGYPFYLRGGIKTAVSIGAVAYSNEQDALTQLLRPVETPLAAQQTSDQNSDSSSDSSSGSSSSSSSNSGSSSDSSDWEDRYGTDGLPVEVTATVPFRQMFSLSMKNVAFDRKAIGPAFVMLPGIVRSTPDFNLQKSFEVLSGWLLKTMCDHMKLGVKITQYPAYVKMQDKPVGLKPPTSIDEETGEGNREQEVGHSNAQLNTPQIPRSEFNAEQLFKNELPGDMQWYAFHEKVLRFLSNVELSNHAADDVGDGTRELSKQVRYGLGTKHPGFNRVADLMEGFANLWGRRNAFDLKLLPVANRSSLAPRPDSQHGCAMFTISHNETFLLDMWLRFYGSHFPNAIWILNHHSGADEEANKMRASPELMKKYGARSIELYGDKAGFPMGFFTYSAELMQQRLYRMGYKCVMLSDVDEIIVPDPDLYPGGLGEYVKRFAADPAHTVIRANGYIVAHISQADGADGSGRQEPPMNWTGSFLAQRHYMYVQPKYSKPLLAKIPIRYRPGFHNVFIPVLHGGIPMDESLILFHLREVDRDVCMQREYMKYGLILRAHQSELDRAFNMHISGYEELNKKGVVCQFAKATYYKSRKAAVDNTGMMTLEKIPERWRTVQME